MGGMSLSLGLGLGAYRSGGVSPATLFNVLNASGMSFSAYAATDASGNNYPVTKTVLAANGTPYSVL